MASKFGQWARALTDLTQAYEPDTYMYLQISISCNHRLQPYQAFYEGYTPLEYLDEGLLRTGQHVFIG